MSKKEVLLRSDEVLNKKWDDSIECYVWTRISGLGEEFGYTDNEIHAFFANLTDEEKDRLAKVIALDQYYDRCPGENPCDGVYEHVISKRPELADNNFWNSVDPILKRVVGR